MVSVAVRSSGASSPLSRTLHPDGLSDSDEPSLLDPTPTPSTVPSTSATPTPAPLPSAPTSPAAVKRTRLDDTCELVRVRAELGGAITLEALTLTLTLT